MAINFDAAAGFTTAVLIADTTQITQGGTVLSGTDVLQAFPTGTAGTLDPTSSLPVAAALAVVSTHGGILAPHLTNAQVAAIGADASSGGIVDGTFYYNSTTNDFVFREGGINTIIPTGGGAGDVVGQNPVTINTLAFYTTTSGLAINDTSAVNLGVGFAQDVLAQNLISLTGAFNVADPTANTVITFTGTDRKAQASAGVITGTVLSALTIQSPDGAVGAPAYSFASDTDTGIYSAAANTIGFAANGVAAFQANAASTNVNFLKLTASDPTSPVVLETLGTDVNVGLRFNLKGTGQLLNELGTEALPSYSFFGDEDTGMSSSVANVLDFSTSGLIQLRVGGATSANHNIWQLAGGNAGQAITAIANSLGGAPDANVSMHFFSKGTGNFTFATNSDTNRQQVLILDSNNLNTTANLTFRGGVSSQPTPFTYPTIGVSGADLDINVRVQTKGTMTGLLVTGDGTAGNVGRLGLSNSAGTFSTVLAVQDALAATNIIELPIVDGVVGQVLRVSAVSSPTTTLEYASADVSFETATVVLAAADVDALVATPFQLVGAPGAGFMLVPVMVFLIYKTTGGDSFNATTSSFTFSINGVSVGPDIAGSGFITQTTSRMANETLELDGTVVFTLSTLDNQGLFIGNDNAGGEFTGGTANTTLTVITKYLRISTAIGP